MLGFLKGGDSGAQKWGLSMGTVGHTLQEHSVPSGLWERQVLCLVRRQVEQPGHC